VSFKHFKEGPSAFVGGTQQTVMLGSLGIGTSEPGQALTVVKAYETSTPYGYGEIAGFYSNASDVHVGIFSDANGLGGIGTMSNHNFMIRSNGANQVIVTPGGNVGIGTSSPSEKLDVDGKIKVSSGVAKGAGLQHGRKDFTLAGLASTDIQVDWSPALANAGQYTASCMLDMTNGEGLQLVGVVGAGNKTADFVKVRVKNTAVGSLTGILNCIAMVGDP